MSAIVIPLKSSPWLLTWLAASHVGALVCLLPMPLPLSVRLTLMLLIGLSFYYGCLRQKRLRVFQQLEYQATSQTWILSDFERAIECSVRLKPGCWLTEHFLLLNFSSTAYSGKITLLFSADHYSRQALSQLRAAVLNNQYKQQVVV